MHLLILSLCAVATVLIVLDATPCSMDKRKEMLIKVCGGHYRKKRGSSFNDYSYNGGKGASKHRSVSQNDLHFAEATHPHRHDHIHVIANDTTGGILIRRKRRGSLEDFMYCCLDLGNCTFIC